MIDIFIAYSSKDRIRVWPLAAALKEYGWRVWWDQEIRIGAKVDQAVHENLKAARAIVAACSANSFDSDWFFGETEAARERNALFPVLLDEVELPLWLRRTQAVRFAGWSERPASPEFQRLAADIENILGPPDRSGEKVEDFKTRNFENPFREADSRPEDQAGTSDDGRAAGADKGADGPSKRSLDADFVDPTIEFPTSSGPKPHHFPPDSVRVWGRRLLSERLIGVRSPNDEITSAAVDALLDLDELKEYDTRLLAFGAANQERTDLFLENLIRHGVGKSNRATIVVVDPHGARPFIESTFCGPHKAKAIAMELRWRDLLFIVQIGSRYRRDLEQRFDTFRFGCWDVDWLEALLTSHFPEREAQTFLRRLVEQRNNGNWGKPHDDLEFHEILQTVLSGGRDSLEQALARPESTRPESRRPQPALDAFRSGPLYYQGILLCAAFFPGLDVTEFRKVCLSIVGDAKVPDSARDQNRRVMPIPRLSTLREKWPNVADDIFQQCGLVVSKSQGLRSVSFAQPEERAALIAYIDGLANYFSDTAQKLWEAGFFFGRDSSTELVDGMIQLFVAVMGHDTARKQPQWLSQTLLRQLSVGRAEGLEDFLQKTALDALVLSRASLLLRALLANPEHAPLVTIWLSDLLSRKGYFQALRLAMYLRYTDGFDYLFWLKRFCDEGPDNVRRASYSALYQHARQSAAQIWDFFSELESWLPGRGKVFARELSKSNWDSLRLIVEYSFDAADELKPQDIGSWPARYPLFRDFALNSESANTHLASLLSWLFHPALMALFHGDSDTVPWTVRGRLISLWSYILLGLDAKLTHPHALQIYRQILALCWQHTDQHGRRRLCEVWQDEQKQYQSERSGLTREGFRYFTKRIHLLENLESDFRQAATGGRGSAEAGQERWNTAQT